jgi:phytoene dehydrogenase-like protein
MSNSNKSDHADVVIVGGGLAGLATAARLGRAGLRVIVCERASLPGGRGRTLSRSGFALNLGPHALYLGGPAATLLRSLDVQPRGHKPSSKAIGWGVILRDDREHILPTSPLSMLSTTALELRSKFELIRFFARIARMSTTGLEHVSTAEWLAEQVPGEDLRPLVHALVRIATYCDELDTFAADAALIQLQHALRGVLYLDGGWLQLVDALVERCLAAGVELRFDARVHAVGRSDVARWAVELDDRTIACEQLIVAGSPTLADTLLGPLLGGPRFAAGTQPITAACLDLGLRGAWPGPGLIFDLDEPIYMSVHSNVADLAPAGHTLVSFAWYRRACDAPTPAAELRERLERCARRWFPNYESALVVEQFLPEMVVAHDRPQPNRGSLRGRASARVDEGLFVVGDWVGDRGHLLDASLASAATVCTMVLGESARAGSQITVAETARGLGR